MANNYSALQKEVINQIKLSGEAQKRAVSGALGAGVREAQSSARIASSRGGLFGPISQALEERALSRAAKTAAEKSANIDANVGQQVAAATNTLGQAGIQEQLARDIAFQEMVGSIIGGAGQVAGTIAGMGAAKNATDWLNSFNDYGEPLLPNI